MRRAVSSGVCVVLATAAVCGEAFAQSANGIKPPISNPCTAGDALLTDRHLDDAREFYLAQLKQRPALTCAEFGLAAVAGLKRHAQRELEEGDRARAQRDDLLAEVAATRKAAAQLKGKKKTDKIAEAEKSEGRAEDHVRIARAAYKEALAHDADLSLAKDRLESLPAETKKEKNWVERGGDWVKTNFLDRADDAGRMLAFGVAVLLALALVATALLRFLTQFKWLGCQFAKRRFLRRLAHRSLVIGTIDGEAQLDWQLRDALGAASAPLGEGVDLSTGTDSADQILQGVGKALGKLPQGTLLAGAWQLLRLLMTRTPLKAEGKTLSAGARGVGLTLTLARGRRVVRTVTLWQQTYERGPVLADEKVAPPWERLAIAGAVWTQYIWLDHLGGPRLTQSLGTEDWQSFAFLQVGLAVVTRDADRDLAQAMFAQALDRDATNSQALFNLAVVDRRRQEPAQAIERLSRLEAAVAPGATPRGEPPATTNRPRREEASRRDTLWFQAAYNLAAAYSQRHLAVYEPGVVPVANPDFDKALRWARLVVRDLEIALSWYDDKRGSLTVTQRSRRTTLDAVEGPAIALLAGLHAMRIAGEGVNAEPVHFRLTRGDIVNSAEASQSWPDRLVEGFLVKNPRTASYRARYNLACYHSRLAAMSEPPDTVRLLERALSELAWCVSGSLLRASRADTIGWSTGASCAPLAWPPSGVRMEFASENRRRDGEHFRRSQPDTQNSPTRLRRRTSSIWRSLTSD